MTDTRPGKERLDSWKEIAAYLHRDIRTVIRWEQNRDLPIRRVPGAKRQAVFAYRDEIDAWLAGDRLTVDVAPKVDTGRSDPQVEPHAAVPSRTYDGEPAHAVRGITFAHRGKIFIVSGALALAVIVALIVSSLSSTSVSVRPLGLQQLTDDNRYKMNLRADQENLYFNEFEVNREILVSTPISGGPIHQINTPFQNVDLQDVSEDGVSILVTSFEGTELDRPLWVISANNENAPFRVGTLRCRAANWSRVQQRIACANGTFITLTKLDGSQERHIGPLPGVVTKVIWSPDGERLRFVLQDLQNRDFTAWEIKVGREWNNRPSAPAMLDWGQNCCADWAWAENSKHFFYVKYEDKPILRMQSDSGKDADVQSEIPIHIGYTAWLAASGDDAIYLLSQNTLQNEVLKFDSKRRIFQTILPSLSATFLGFSRDGKWMTYTDPNNSLWRSHIDGSDAVRLAGPPMEVELSSWSPDGAQIAFMGREPGRVWRIYVVGRDGGELREASLSEDSQGAPSWSPDGRKLAYGNVDCLETNSCWIRILDLRSGKTETVPDSHGFRTARWSPDGKYIAALIPGTHKAVLFDVNKQEWRPLADSITGDNLTWSQDSEFVYADNPRDQKPVIERFQVANGKRSDVVKLTSLGKAPGQIDFWFGLAPDGAPLIVHRFTSSEVYRLSWAGK